MHLITMIGLFFIIGTILLTANRDKSIISSDEEIGKECLKTFFQNQTENMLFLKGTLKEGLFLNENMTAVQFKEVCNRLDTLLRCLKTCKASKCFQYLVNEDDTEGYLYSLSIMFRANEYACRQNHDEFVENYNCFVSDYTQKSSEFHKCKMNINYKENPFNKLASKIEAIRCARNEIAKKCGEKGGIIGCQMMKISLNIYLNKNYCCVQDVAYC